jgi:hypothetical protein
VRGGWSGTCLLRGSLSRRRAIAGARRLASRGRRGLRLDHWPSFTAEDLDIEASASRNRDERSLVVIVETTLDLNQAPLRELVEDRLDQHLLVDDDAVHELRLVVERANANRGDARTSLKGHRRCGMDGADEEELVHGWVGRHVDPWIVP